MRLRQNIAEAAYQEAVAYLKKEFEGKPDEIAWIEGRKSLDEVRAEAHGLETRYFAVGGTKKTVLHAVRRISSWIMFYGQVLDVLSQHHPEYLALAWGSVRFILMVMTFLTRCLPHLTSDRASSTTKQ